MERAYWLRQKVGSPLFPELEWSRPENRNQAGKLLIAGGNLHGFAAPAEAYSLALKDGIGTARVLLPDAVQKIVGRFFAEGDFAPSTPSGSFSQKALDELLMHAAWADAVLFAGDLGRNSETAILLEKFLAKSPLTTALTKDCIDYVTSAPHTVLNREDTLLVLSLSQLQRLGVAAKSTSSVSYGMDLMHLVEWLHDFTLTHRPYIIVKQHNQIVVAAKGQVSTTTLTDEKPIWRVEAATLASVWWLQNPTKPFEALTSAVAQLS
jgi:hypothetical protein